MSTPKLDKETKNRIITYQKNEITEYHIYSKLSKKSFDIYGRSIHIDRVFF